tara:strand:+ start:216 stop:500 length:285 start_codon:yes stop_codon:yes gene_type:complete
MQVISHYNIAVYNQTFILNTIFQAFDKDIPVYSSAENIHPSYYLTGQKVGGILIFYLIAIAHTLVKGSEYGLILKRSGTLRLEEGASSPWRRWA